MQDIDRLDPKDIEYKIEVNKRDYGHGLERLRELLIDERHDFERAKIRNMIQIQNLNEQIDYIDKKIKRGE